MSEDTQPDEPQRDESQPHEPQRDEIQRDEIQADLTQADQQRLADAGVYDPAAPHAADQLELFRYLLSLGATVDDIAASPTLGELAIDRRLRPLGPRTLGEVVEQSGLSWPTTRRFLIAIGLPTDPDRRITDAEAETVRLFVERRRGCSARRPPCSWRVSPAVPWRGVAETIVASFRLRFELPRRAAGRVTWTWSRNTPRSPRPCSRFS